MGYNIAARRFNYQFLPPCPPDDLLQNYGMPRWSSRDFWLFPLNWGNSCECFGTLCQQVPCIPVPCKLGMIDGGRGGGKQVMARHDEYIRGFACAFHHIKLELWPL